MEKERGQPAHLPRWYQRKRNRELKKLRAIDRARIVTPALLIKANAHA